MHGLGGHHLSAPEEPTPLKATKKTLGDDPDVSQLPVRAFYVQVDFGLPPQPFPERLWETARFHQSWRAAEMELMEKRFLTLHQTLNLWPWRSR